MKNNSTYYSLAAFDAISARQSVRMIAEEMMKPDYRFHKDDLIDIREDSTILRQSLNELKTGNC